VSTSECNSALRVGSQNVPSPKDDMNAYMVTLLEVRPSYWELERKKLGPTLNTSIKNVLDTIIRFFLFKEYKPHSIVS